MLKRELTLLDATVYGVGLILGAGIYVLIGKAAAITGGSLWLSFIFAALIASFTGLSYAELASMYPKAAAEYVYVKHAFSNRILPLIIGFLSIFVGLFSAATVALGFAGYLHELLLPVCNLPVTLIAVILVIVLSGINFYGVKESARLNMIFTAIEASGLVFIIFLGLPHLGTVNYLEMPRGITGVFSAAALIFFSYLGFQEMANMAEETKHARRNIPLAIIISMVITTLLYVLVAISSVSVLPPEVLGKSKAPLAEVAEASMPGSSSFLSFVALFATLNTVLIILVVTSRMFYGMAERSRIFRPFSYVHKKRGTPWVAVLVTMVLVCMLTLIGNVKTVALITDLGSFIIFFAVNVSLIVLRYKKPHAKREFKVPLSIGRLPIIPLLGALTSVFMMLQFEIHIILITFGAILFSFVTFFVFDTVLQKETE